MCNACGFLCCAWDGFAYCGCDGCEEPLCWTEDEEDYDDEGDFGEYDEDRAVGRGREIRAGGDMGRRHRARNPLPCLCGPDRGAPGRRPLTVRSGTERAAPAFRCD